MRYILILSFVLLLACKKEEAHEPDPLKVTIEYKQLDGIDPDLLSLDIYYNSEIERKKSVVIWVHGGGWCIGDKVNQIENKVSLFRSLDYILVSVNYRLSPFPYDISNNDRIIYPDHNTDVADAISWIIDNIGTYGGNSAKVALLGHSAGAHLVALTGTNSSFLEGVGLGLGNIKGIAIIDTEGYNAQTKVQDNNELYINAFGTDNDLNIQASPLLNIKDGVNYPKFFVAKRGQASRIAIANDFINRLESHGASVWQVDGSIYDHSGINDAIGKTNKSLITPVLINFFAECFK